MAVRTLLLLLFFSFALFVTSVSAADCVPEKQLWGALITRQHTRVSEEEIFCLHGQVHPTKKKFKCVEALSDFKEEIDEAVALCKEQNNPKKIPKYIVLRVQRWAHYQRVLGVREEVICCVHGRVHKHFAKSRRQRLNLGFNKLHDWQLLCSNYTNRLYGFAY